MDLLLTAQIAGLCGFMLLFIQFVTSIKVPSVRRLIGNKLLMNVHQFTGRVGFFVILTHPVLMNVYAYQVDGKIEQNLYMFFGVVSLGVIITTVITTVFRKQMRIELDTWKLIHKSNYILLPLVYMHSITLGTTLKETPALQFSWYAIFGLYVLIYLFNYREGKQEQ